MKVARRDTADVLVDTLNNNIDASIGSFSTASDTVEQTSNFGMGAKKSVESVLQTVRLNKNHSCYIGGVYYVFERNKVYQVPPDVKRILTVAKLLAPL